VKAAFDTSVLVAAVVEGHPQHAAALSWVGARRKLERVGSMHALAETWAVLTRLPMLDAPLSPGVARAVVDRLAKRIALTPPSAKLYAAALGRCEATGARSGAVFDALHLVTAEHAGVDVLLTFNLRDFERLAVATSPRIVDPAGG
jgi:predicted nucleic acid-binding protein